MIELIRSDIRHIFLTSLRVGIPFQVHTSPTTKGRLRMSSPGVQKPKRSWQEIAAEASVEKDPKKLQHLADELAKALDERDELGKVKSA